MVYLALSMLCQPPKLAEASQGDATNLVTCLGPFFYQSTGIKDCSSRTIRDIKGHLLLQSIQHLVHLAPFNYVLDYFPLCVLLCIFITAIFSAAQFYEDQLEILIINMAYLTCHKEVGIICRYGVLFAPRLLSLPE